MKRLVTLAICLLFVLLAAQLSTAQKPELVVQTGHSNGVGSVAFSPDGKTLASGSADHTIKLWDVTSGTELRTLIGHSETVTSVAFSPDGKILASGSFDHMVKLWDVSTGTPLRTLTVGHPYPVTSIAFSQDGKTLVSGSYDSTVTIWEVSTGRALRTLMIEQGHPNVLSVAFSPDGKTLASGSSDSTVRIWEVSTGTELRTLIVGHGHANVNSVAFSPDGKTLASGSSDSTVSILEVSTGTELRTFKGAAYWVSSVAFSPDGKTLASGGFGTVKLWDVSTGTELRNFGEGAGTIAFSPDGKSLARASFDHTVKLWDVSTGTELRTLKGHNPIGSVAFSPDGKTLAGAGFGAVKLWDVLTGRELRTIKGLSDLVAFSPALNTVATSAGLVLEQKKIVKLWDLSTGTELRTFERTFGGVRSLALSPNGTTLAIGLYGDSVELWDVSTGKPLRTLKQEEGSARGLSVAFSPDGKSLATSSGNGHTVKLWDVSTGTQLRTLDLKLLGFDLFVFSPDGKTLACGGFGTVKLWDVLTGAELRTLQGHSGLVGSLALSSDGKILASGSDDQTVKLWEVSTGTEVRTLNGHSNAVTSVAFSPNGKYLVSASSDGSTKVWETSSGKELVSLIAIDEHDWIVVTPDGLFDGSPAAWNRIIWRFNNNMFDHAPVEAFFNEFYYPGLLVDIFADKRPKAPSDISQKDRRQPQLKITPTGAQANATLTARNLTVKIGVSELAADKEHKAGCGALDVRLFRNGSLVKVWRGDVLKGKSNATLEATIPIVAGENKLTAYAFNHDNIKSTDATLTVTGADSLKRKGTAYILAVGVNVYSNQNYNLKYAVADAEDFSVEVKRRLEAQKRYAQVEVISLSDAEANKASILQKLTQLASRVQPEDALIVYFAGHGTAHGNEFYLIPHDLGYDGPREKLDTAGLQAILDHGISDRDLEKVFEGIDAAQLVLVIDACNSGQALEAEEKRRGPMNSKGLAQLAYEKGMYILTAAQSYQAAQEAAKFGHGFLTYALVEEGLKQGAADREPKNGTIDVRKWLNYATEEVPRMQEASTLDALRGRGRYVIFVGDGRDIGIPKNDAGARDNIQRPRVFYRRELESNPLVVAVLDAAPRQ
jgi:WD40 repeat protein